MVLKIQLFWFKNIFITVSCPQTPQVSCASLPCSNSIHTGLRPCSIPWSSLKCLPWVQASWQAHKTRGRVKNGASSGRTQKWERMFGALLIFFSWFTKSFLKKKGPSGRSGLEQQSRALLGTSLHIAGPEDHGQGGGGAVVRPSSGSGERTGRPRGATYLWLRRGAWGGHLRTEIPGRNPRRSHGKEPLVRPTQPSEIRPDEGEASRLGLARSCLGPRAVTTPAAYQTRYLAVPQPQIPSPPSCAAFQASLEPPPRCQFLLLWAKERYDRPPPDQKASPGTFPGRPQLQLPSCSERTPRSSLRLQWPLDYISRRAKWAGEAGAL